MEEKELFFWQMIFYFRLFLRVADRDIQAPSASSGGKKQKKKWSKGKGKYQGMTASLTMVYLLSVLFPWKPCSAILFFPTGGEFQMYYLQMMKERNIESMRTRREEEVEEDGAEEGEGEEEKRLMDRWLICDVNGTVKDKANHAVVLDKATSDKLNKDVQSYRLITVSTLVDRLKINGSLARKALHDLEQKGQIKKVVGHSKLSIYSMFLSSFFSFFPSNVPKPRGGRILSPWLMLCFSP
jgi:small subunit ribosomal protein S25e